MSKRPNDLGVDVETIPSVRSKITSLQDKFVDEYISNGGVGSKAAIKAGYSENTAAQISYVLLRKPHIMQEIYRRTVEQIGLAAPKALGTIVGLIDKAKSDYVRLEAAKDILDRSGMRPPERVNHKIDGDLSIKIDLG